jgi:hypothetical protein
VFDFVTQAGLLDIVLFVVAIGATIGALARGSGSHEAKTLRKENHRLRNILANLMIDKAQIRDIR